MDAYTLFKFLHIACAIAWIGGGVTLFAMAVFASARKDDQELLGILKGFGLMANRWFVPASLLTLLFGIVMAILGNLWGEAWVVLGLVGFAATFVTGHFIMRVRAMEAGRLIGEGRIAEAADVGRSVIKVAKFDYVMLFTVVADMVLKPSWTDFTILGAFALVLALAGWLFLGSPQRPAAAQAA